jgi:tetratricopeptide (TPR) repeat protein
VSHRRNKRGFRRSKAPAAPPVAPKPAEPTRTLSSRRRWVSRLIAAIILPLFLLVILEGARRLTGYGYTTRFFRSIRSGNREFIVNNETFSLRFFPPQLARWPGPIMMDATKPRGTYRIFILGESAARGEPEPPFSAARHLEVLLRERFPGQKFEVVNVAITAINSHVILPIARELARQHGDLWIIYMGNNEMVGPFGAVTVFGAQAPPLSLIRLSLAIQQTRTGQLLMALARWGRGKAATPSAWGGMKMFLGNHIRPGSPRKQGVYKSFEQNLQDILRLGLNSGAKVLLNTVDVNLKDCPPFASLTNSTLDFAERTAWDSAYGDGCRARSEGRLPEAEQCFERAARVDAVVSDLQFRWGECLLALTNYTAARQRFQLACDYDALPFRADSQINGLIRQLGNRWANPNLHLFDAAAAMATNVPAGINGQDVFYEHVHFNFEGQYRLGLAWAEQVELCLPQAIRNRAVGGWATQGACERWLGLTDWGRQAVVMSVMDRLRRPPFCNQFDNDRCLAGLQTQATELQHQMTRATADQAKADFIDAISRAPDDHWLHENFAEFLESIGDAKLAIAEWRRARALLPQNCVAYYQLGRLLAQQGFQAEAEECLLRAVAMRPNLADGWSDLGNLYLATARFGSALNAYQRAQQLEGQQAVFYLGAGKALAKLNRRAEAIRQYREALGLNPTLAEAHFSLGEELAGGNQMAEAQLEYEQVIQLQPTNALGHLNLGVTLAVQGRFDPALHQFAEALRLDPGNKLAQEYYDRVQGWKSRKPGG